MENVKLVRDEDRLAITGSNVTFKDCEITRVAGYTSGALVDVKPGASDVTFDNCVITSTVDNEQTLVRTRENAKSVTFTDCTFDNNGDASCIYADGENLTLNNCTLKNADFGIYCDKFSGEMEVTGCTFTNLPTNLGRADTAPAATFTFSKCKLAGYVGFVADSTVTFTDCNFTKASKLDGSYNADWNQVFTCSDVTFTGCTFTEDYLGKVYVSVNNPSTVIVMNDCSVVHTEGNVSSKTVADLASTNITDSTAANPSGVLAIDAVLDDDGNVISGTLVGAKSNITNVVASSSTYDEETGTVTSDTSESFVAKIGDTEYESLSAAVTVASNGDTITLGEGEFTLFDTEIANNKTLTFKGQGVEKTTWIIGDSTATADYSFKGATITFEDMHLKTAVENANYLGFAHIDNSTVKNCKITGRTAYWGYQTATFEKQLSSRRRMTTLFGLIPLRP